ncbi:MAG: hypothetical protein IH957_00715 [Chloroflexi bacterium]|nr:hypothetical protein [Chloroflexota bacterium]
MGTIAGRCSHWARRAIVAGGVLALLLLWSGVISSGAASGPVSETSSTASGPVSETSSSTAGPVSETSSTAAGPMSETSSSMAAPQPTPTYVSELAPAVAIAPREPATLPATGVASGGVGPWPKLSGLALAFLGAFSIYAALVLRPEDAR